MEQIGYQLDQQMDGFYYKTLILYNSSYATAQHQGTYCSEQEFWKVAILLVDESFTWFSRITDLFALFVERELEVILF